MIWIITAMPQEAQIIIEKYNLKLAKQYKNIKFFSNENIVLVITGIWKIQASIWTTLLLNLYKLDKIINIWIAGNTWLDSKSKIGDVFIVKKVYQHDWYLPFDWSHLDYFKLPITLPEIKISKIFDFNLIYGDCATWDQFIDDQKLLEKIKNTYKVHIVEMEAFAVASVVREFDLLDKLIIIKAVSDWWNKKATQDHEKNLDLAMKNSINVLDFLIFNN